jgi:hypothetical protein
MKSWLLRLSTLHKKNKKATSTQKQNYMSLDEAICASIKMGTRKITFIHNKAAKAQASDVKNQIPLLQK